MCIEQKFNGLTKNSKYHFQFVKHVSIEWMITISTHIYDFNMGTFLPSGVRCQKHHGLCEKSCNCFISCKEEWVAIVSYPVKKNVLQLSINCCMPKWTFPPFTFRVFCDVVVSMRPNKSFPYEAVLVIFTICFRAWIISLRDLEMPIWVIRILIFSGVGRILHNK